MQVAGVVGGWRRPLGGSASVGPANVLLWRRETRRQTRASRAAKRAAMVLR
jgi:hypothetical protein